MPIEVAGALWLLEAFVGAQNHVSHHTLRLDKTQNRLRVGGPPRYVQNNPDAGYGEFAAERLASCGCGAGGRRFRVLIRCALKTRSVRLTSSLLRRPCCPCSPAGWMAFPKTDELFIHGSDVRRIATVNENMAEDG